MDIELTACTANEDFHASEDGTRRIDGWPGYRRACVTAPLFDARLALNLGFYRLAREAVRMATRRVHITSVDTLAHPDELERILREFKNTRQAVTVLLLRSRSLRTSLRDCRTSILAR